MSAQTKMTASIRAFGAIANAIRTNTDDRRNEVCSEITDALTYIGAKSGQDAPFRSALDRIEREAPRGKRGTVSPSATKLLNAARTALTAGKLAYSRVQKANKIADLDAWHAECAVIVAEFRASAWTVRAEAAPKAKATALDKARAALTALTGEERTVFLAECMALVEPAKAPTVPARQRKPRASAKATPTLAEAA